MCSPVRAGSGCAVTGAWKPAEGESSPFSRKVSDMPCHIPQTGATRSRIRADRPKTKRVRDPNQVREKSTKRCSERYPFLSNKYSTLWLTTVRKDRDPNPGHNCSPELPAPISQVYAVFNKRFPCTAQPCLGPSTGQRTTHMRKFLLSSRPVLGCLSHISSLPSLSLTLVITVWSEGVVSLPRPQNKSGPALPPAHGAALCQ